MALIETRERTTTKRFFYHCKIHKYHKALDIEITATTSTYQWPSNGRIVHETTKTYRVGKQSWIVPPIQKCPECLVTHPGRENLTPVMVKGYITDHVCDARCTNAKGQDCECSCGGANHGSAYL